MTVIVVKEGAESTAPLEIPTFHHFHPLPAKLLASTGVDYTISHD